MPSFSLPYYTVGPVEFLLAAFAFVGAALLIGFVLGIAIWVFVKALSWALSFERKRNEKPAEAR